MANGITFNIGFNSDISNVTSDLNKLKMLLNQITNDPIKLSDSDFKSAIEAANILKSTLEDAYDASTENINLGKFSDSLKSSGQNLTTLASKLRSAGSQGNEAFNSLTKAIVNAQIPTKKTSQLLDDMWVSLKNIAKWNISTSIINSFQGSIQKAYYYSKDLDQSLNNIRIVTGKSKEEMADFADTANDAAKGLSAATTAYTDASLIYYQQGLDDEEVEARAAVTLKAANVARTSAEQMSEYLTAIWNGYKVDASEAELYVDKVSAVAATTASDLGELAEGFSRVASAANSMGVGVDQLNAYLATVISTTREAPETIGTSFKTIFARLNSISLGDEEDGWGLSEVGKTLEKIGVSLADAQGNLRATGDVIDEIGSKWSTMSKETQQAVAVAMAGRQQYSRLISLFDNWDQYQQTLLVSQNAAGSLQEQANIYAEGWEAASQRVSTSLESLYQKALNSDFFIEILNNFTKFIDGLDKTVDKLGGFKNILIGIGSIGSKVFSKQIGSGINNLIENLSVFTGSAYNKSTDIFNQLSLSIDEFLSSHKNLTSAQQKEYKDQQAILGLRSELADSMKKMSAEQVSYTESQIKYIQNLQREKQAIDQQVSSLEEKSKKLDIIKQKELSQVDDIPDMTKTEAEQMKSNVLSEDERNRLNKLKIEQQKNENKNNLKIQEDIAKIEKDQNQRIEVLYKSEKEILSIYEKQYALYSQIDSAALKLNSIEKLNKDNAQAILDIYVKDNQVRENLSNKIQEILNSSNDEEKKRQEIYDLLVRTSTVAESYANNIDVMTENLDAQKNIIRQSVDAHNAEADAVLRAREAQSAVNTEFNRVKESIGQVKVDAGQFASSIVSTTMSFVNLNAQLKDMVDILYDDSISGFEKFTIGLEKFIFTVPEAIASGKEFYKNSKAIGQSLTTFAANSTGAASAVAGFGAAVASAAGPLMIIASVISIAIAAYQAYQRHLEEVRQARVEADDALLESLNTQIEEVKGIEKTEAQYKELLETYRETGEVSDDMTSTIEELTEAYGLEGTAIAQLTGDYDKLTAAIQRNREIKNQELLDNAQKTFGSAKNTLDQNVGDYDLRFSTASEQEAAKVRKILNELKIEYAETEDALSQGGKIFDFTSSGSQVYEMIKAFEEAGQSWNDTMDMQLEEYHSYIQGFEEETANYEEALLKVKETGQKVGLDNIFDLSLKYEELSTSEFEELKQQGVSALEAIGYSTEEATEKLNQYLNTQSNTVKKLNTINEGITEQVGLIRGQGIDVNRNDFINYFETLSEGDQIQLLDFEPRFAADWTSFKAEFESSLISAVDESVQTNRDIIQQALMELFSDAKISEETFEALTEAFPELSSLAEQTYQGQIDLLKNYIEQSNTALIQSSEEVISDLTEKLGYLQSQYEQAYSWMDEAPELYQRYVDAISNLNEVDSGPLAGVASYRDTLVETLNQVENEIRSRFGDGVVIDINAVTNKQNLEDQIEETKDQLDEAFDDPFEIEVDLSLDAADTWITQSEQLAEAASKIGENYRIAADDIEYFANAFPEILDGAEPYKNGMIQLNKEIVDSFLAGKQIEVEGEKQAVIQKLEAKKAELEAALGQVRSQLALAEQLSKGEIGYEEYTQQQVQLSKDITSQYVGLKYGEEAQSAFNSATDQSGYMQALGKDADAATDAIALDFLDAYENANINANTSAQAQINAINQIGQAAARASVAIAGMMSHKEVTYSDASFSGKSGGYVDINPSAGANLSTNIGQLSSELRSLQDNFNSFSSSANQDITNTINNLKNQIKVASTAFGDEQVKFYSAQEGALQNELNAVNAGLLKIKSQSMQTTEAIGKAGKKSGSGGGGGSKEKELELLDDEIDKYHSINKLIEDNSRLLDKASKVKSRLYGSNYLKALEKETELTKRAQELDEKKLAMLEKDVEIARKQANAAGADTDEFGYISNYYEVLAARQAAINARIKAGTITEKELEAEKEAYELTKSLFDAYEEKFDAYIERIDTLEDRARELADQQLEKVTKEVEFKLEISDDSMKVLDYFINKNKEFFELSEKYNLMTQKYQEIPNQMETYYQGILDLQEQLKNPDADHAAINEQIREYRDGIISSLEAMNDLEEEMKHAYADALDGAKDKLEDYTSQLDHVTDSLNHFINIMGLMGKEDHYDTLGTMYDAQINNGKNLLAVQKQMFEGYKQQQELLRQTGMEGTDDWFALVEAIAEAENELYDTTEATLEAIGELYDNTVKGILKTLEESLSGTTYDSVADAYDRYRDEQDRFLTKTEQLYEITKLQDDIQKEIDSTDNPARKQKLKDLSEYVAGLGEQNKLSQYELEYAQAKYDLALKQMALEDAQRSKTNLRLVRNSQGNWTYQYTADQDNIANAQEEYQEAMNKLYEMSLERVSNLEQEIVDLNKEMQEALEAIERDDYETAEQYEAALLEVRRFYQQKLYDIYDQYNIARRNLEQDTYDLTIALTDDAILAGERAKEGYNQNIADMIERLCGEGADSFVGATDVAIEDLVNAWQEWKDAVDEVAEFVEVTEDDLIGKTNELSDASDDLKDTIVNEVIPSIFDEIEAVRQEIQAFNQAKSALAGLKSMYENFISTLKIVEGQAKATADAIDRSSKATGSLSATPSSSNKGGSSGEGGGGGGSSSSGGVSKEKTFYTGVIKPNISSWNDSTHYSGVASCKAAISETISRNGRVGVSYNWKVLKNGTTVVSSGTATRSKSQGGGVEGTRKPGDVLPSTVETGGYTGDWGSQEGRVAILHEKELVLNKYDTKNVLETVNVVRTLKPLLNTIEQELDLKVLRSMNASNISNFNIRNNPGELQQNVKIEATFPNVSSSNEIEEALNNLVNEASQFARRR